MHTKEPLEQIHKGTIPTTFQLGGIVPLRGAFSGGEMKMYSAIFNIGFSAPKVENDAKIRRRQEKKERADALMRAARENGAATLKLQELKFVLHASHVDVRKADRRTLERRLARLLCGDPVPHTDKWFLYAPPPVGTFLAPPLTSFEAVRQWGRGHPFAVPLDIWRVRIFPLLGHEELFALMFSCKQFQACARHTIAERALEFFNSNERGTPLALNAYLVLRTRIRDDIFRDKVARLITENYFVQRGCLEHYQNRFALKAQWRALLEEEEIEPPRKRIRSE